LLILFDLDDVVLVGGLRRHPGLFDLVVVP
jgi:hypothetical protein